jgi:hypothetical protein
MNFKKFILSVFCLFSSVSADPQNTFKNALDLQTESVLLQKYEALKQQKFEKPKSALNNAREIFKIEESLGLGNVCFYDLKKEELAKTGWGWKSFIGAAIIPAVSIIKEHPWVAVGSVVLEWWIVEGFFQSKRAKIENTYVKRQLEAAQNDKRNGMSAKEIQEIYNLTPAVAEAL